MNFARRGLIHLAVFLVLAIPAIVLACGPYFIRAVFVPSYPAGIAELIDGKVGILRPTFSVKQLFLAYRNLNNLPLNETERAAMNAASSEPRMNREAGRLISEEWRKARERLQVGHPIPWLDPVRELKDYSFFVNCAPDAFQTATMHLNDLIERDGASSDSVQRWRDAQDLVFQNCSKDAGIPDAPAPQMTPAQRADRLYQIAAANFYATRYDVAAQQFQAIARDITSPWRDYGLFLAARCYLRKATVGPLLGALRSMPAGDTPPPMDQDSMRKGLTLLQEVAADKTLGRVHDSAMRLISFAELHLEPDKQELRLSSSLRQPSQDAQFATHLDDYLYLPLVPGDELGEWIAAVAGGAKSSIDRWRLHPASQAWLCAALLAADGRSADALELISAALKVDANSAAFATAQYHAARLRFERGEFAQCRRQIDSLLGTHPPQLDASTVAALTILRSRVANSLADFAQFAAALPLSGFGTPGEAPCPSTTGQGERICSSAMITPAAAAMINHMPLSALVRLAALNPSPHSTPHSAPDAAPLPLRRGAAQIAFERGVLLGDFTQADAAARLLSAQSEQDASDLKSYLAARNGEERRLSAAFVMMRWPGVAPSLSVSFIREEKMREPSNFRNNWWGAAQGPKTQSTEPFEYLPTDEAAPRFLDHVERAAGEREFAALGKVESASIWLPRVVIDWAKSHRDDPRVPEALHLAVNATHFGRDTTGSSPYSKKAFQILHRNYPRSPWTAQTKVYY